MTGSIDKVPKDHWSSKAYSASASFVPNLASKILEWLDPQPTDRILDIGCGDGKFTAHFLPAITSPTGEVYGVDSSAQFIREATEAFAREGSSTASKISFRQVDGRKLDSDAYCVSGAWDKVISNAALHWILCTADITVRKNVLRNIHRCLKEHAGAKFVFEFGGAGNVAEISAVVVALLRRDGFSMQEIQRDCVIPWFFPDVTWMKTTLEEVGFRVDVCELVDRPTKLNDVTRDDQGAFVGGGVEGWVRLMLAGVIDVYAARKGDEHRERFIREITEAIEFVADRTYDNAGEGGMWLRYVRLRGVATKV